MSVCVCVSGAVGDNSNAQIRQTSRQTYQLVQRQGGAGEGEDVARLHMRGLAVVFQRRGIVTQTRLGVGYVYKWGEREGAPTDPSHTFGTTTTDAPRLL